ncbi:hypothetical protein C2E23DRAFT_273576 [Lenzites betulinus]|nr:hypothetical protein C2E23DRAFT_273576 [Lenzites betulinus]
MTCMCGRRPLSEAHSISSVDKGSMYTYVLPTLPGAVLSRPYHHFSAIYSPAIAFLQDVRTATVATPVHRNLSPNRSEHSEILPQCSGSPAGLRLSCQYLCNNAQGRFHLVRCCTLPYPTPSGPPAAQCRRTLNASLPCMPIHTVFTPQSHLRELPALPAMSPRLVYRPVLGLLSICVSLHGKEHGASGCIYHRTRTF